MDDETTRHIAELAAETEVLRIALRELSSHLPTIEERSSFVATVNRKVQRRAADSSEPARTLILDAWEQLGIR